MESLYRRIVIVTCFVTTVTLFAQHTEEILLPMERSVSENDEVVQLELNESANWQQMGKLGWRALWNENTRTPHRAWGSPIKIRGYDEVDDSTIDDVVEVFLSDFEKPLGISIQNLRLVKKFHAQDIWYVTLQQYFKELPVLYSSIELRISDNATVSLIGVDYYNDIQLSEAVDLPAEQLINDRPSFDVNDNRGYAILPIAEGLSITFHKVVCLESTVENLAAYIDVKTSKVLWQRSTVCHAFSGTATGIVQETLSTDTPEEFDFPHLYYRVNGERFTTGPNGEFDIDIDQSSTLDVKMEGPYVRINNASQPNARIEKTIEPEEEVIIKWDDSNSAKSERNAFYHTNIAHDTLKAIDPEYEYLDFSLQINVNRSPAGCNAFYNGSSINYDIAGGGCVSGADIAMVVYHEYGHAIIDKIFINRGVPIYPSRAADEAQADVFATMIENSPIFAPGFFGPGTSTRNLASFRAFPSGVDPNSPHLTGLILSGSYWDLSRRTSTQLVNRLAHFAKYGASTSIDVGTVFKDWFIETLIADDDDGDLTNGTPHFEDINWAFERHGINVRGIVDDGILGVDEMMNFEVRMIEADENCKLQLEVNETNSEYDVSIYDTSGRVINRYTRIRNNSIIDIDNTCRDRMLIVTVHSGGKTYSRKILAH